MKRTLQLYTADLTNDTLPTILPLCPVEFSTVTERATEVLYQGGQELGMNNSQYRELKRQVSEGETCFSGWINEAMVFYGWIQYRYRYLARRTKIYLPPYTAFIFRCYTVENFRGKYIYSAALSYALEYLRLQDFQKVFIEHRNNNISSRLGILRAGFIEVGQYTVCGWGPAKFASVSSALQ